MQNYVMQYGKISKIQSYCPMCTVEEAFHLAPWLQDWKAPGILSEETTMWPTLPDFYDLSDTSPGEVFKLGARVSGKNVSTKIPLYTLEDGVLEYYDIMCHHARVQIFHSSSNFLISSGRLINYEHHAFSFETYDKYAKSIAYPSRRQLHDFLNEYESSLQLEYLDTKLCYEMDELNYLYCYNIISFKNKVILPDILPIDVEMKIISFAYL